jgi:antitoxin component YwqK of YwqJK toxin-antitoxin module
MNRHSLIFLILFITISNCNLLAQTFKVFKGDTINRTDAKGLKQGDWKKYYDNNQLFSFSTYKDGKPYGVTKTYYKSGEKQSEMVHAMNGKTSYMTMFWPNGKRKAIGKYIGQEKDSTWNFYNESDSLTSIENYRMGKAHGTWIIFYANGKISEQTQWADGLKDGIYTSYFASGAVKSTMTYKKGSLNGSYTVNHPNGKPYIAGGYAEGLMQGLWKYNADNGNLDSVHTYIKGNRQFPKK